MADRKYKAVFKTEVLNPDGCTIIPDGFSSIEFHHVGSNGLSSYAIDGLSYNSYMFQTPPRVYDSGGYEVIANSFKVTKSDQAPIQGFTIKKYYEPIN